MTRNVDLVEHVIKPKGNQAYFLKKSESIFRDFLQQLLDETSFGTTTVIQPLINELRALTFTFSESTQNKNDVDAFRKSFGEIVTKHEKIFDAQSSEAANRLYKLIFNVSRDILGLVTPPSPDSAQPYVNTKKTFFTPKNPNLSAMDTALEGDQHSSVLTH